jgi:hypothetical protein
LNRRRVAIAIAIALGGLLVYSLAASAKLPSGPPEYCVEKARVDSEMQAWLSAKSGYGSKEFWAVDIAIGSLARGPATKIAGPATSALSDWNDALAAAQHPVYATGIGYSIDHAATDRKVGAALSALQNDLSQIQGYCDAKS